MKPFASPALVAAAALATPVVHAADELSEVVVTTTAFHGSPEDVIHPIVVLDAADLLRERGSSLGETLARQPGLSATGFSPAASRPLIRGLGGERVQTLEDGLGSLDVAALSEDHAVSVEDGTADQIEILKGPATLLYGSGAVGGAVNVLTRRIPLRVPDALAGEATLRGDSASGEGSAQASLRGGHGPLAFHVDGYHRDSSDLRTPAGRVANSDRDASGGSFGVSLVGDAGFIGVSASRLDDHYGIPFLLEEEHDEDEGHAEEDGHDHGGARIALRQDRYTLRGEWRRPGAGWENLRLAYVHADYRHAELEPDGAIGTLFTQQGQELRLTGDHRTGGWLGTVGLQYRQVDFEAAGEEVFVPPSTTRNLGLFAFEQFPLGRATVEAGLRWERQTLRPVVADNALPDYQDDAFSGSLGLLQPLGDTLSLVANVTLSQRHPAAPELYADGPHAATGQFVIGDTALGLERARALDLGLRHRGERLRWQIDAFVNDFSGFIYLAPTPLVVDDLPVYLYRQADARFTGAEAQLQVPLWTQGTRELSVDLSADVVRGRLRQGGGNLPQLPPWRLGLGLSYDTADWKSGLSLWQYGRQDRVAEYETSTGGYTLLEARLERQWLLQDGARLTASLRGSNLTDQLARRHSSPLKDIVPLPGRGITLSLRLAL
jgi:iron complex outermembrane receptor protein